MPKKKEKSNIVVTNVRVFPVTGNGLGHIKALVTITINNAITIRGLRLMEGSEGFFVGYPLDPFSKGEDFRSLVIPTTREARVTIEDAIIEAYKKNINQKEN